MIKNDENIDEILFEDIPVIPSRFGMGKHNNSHYFLLPLFGLAGLVNHKNNYISSYIMDDKRDCFIEDPLFIVFGFKEFDSDEHNKANNYFNNIENFKFSYYAGNNDNRNLVVYVMKTPSYFTSTYKHIVKGEYSKVCNRYRSAYRRFPFSPTTIANMEAITLKQEWYKKKMEEDLGITIGPNDELWNTFEPQRETFRYVENKAK